mgnify:CR=1
FVKINHNKSFKINSKQLNQKIIYINKLIKIVQPQIFLLILKIYFSPKMKNLLQPLKIIPFYTEIKLYIGLS